MLFLRNQGSRWRAQKLAVFVRCLLRHYLGLTLLNNGELTLDAWILVDLIGIEPLILALVAALLVSIGVFLILRGVVNAFINLTGQLGVDSQVKYVDTTGTCRWQLLHHF